LPNVRYQTQAISFVARLKYLPGQIKLQQAGTAAMRKTLIEWSNTLLPNVLVTAQAVPRFGIFAVCVCSRCLAHLVLQINFEIMIATGMNRSEAELQLAWWPRVLTWLCLVANTVASEQLRECINKMIEATGQTVCVVKCFKTVSNMPVSAGQGCNK
jgi:hypothetical protein